MNTVGIVEGSYQQRSLGEDTDQPHQHKYISLGSSNSKLMSSTQQHHGYPAPRQHSVIFRGAVFDGQRTTIA